jgi:hypothetical protein
MEKNQVSLLKIELNTEKQKSGWMLMISVNSVPVETRASLLAAPATIIPRNDSD